MKILVAGSIDVAQASDTQDNFKSACKALGRKILESGHELIISSERPDSADAFFLKVLYARPGVGGSGSIITRTKIRPLRLEFVVTEIQKKVQLIFGIRRLGMTGRVFVLRRFIIQTLS